MNISKPNKKIQLLFLLFFLGINSSVFAQEKILKINEPAPTFALKSLQDDYVYLRDFCGKLRPPVRNKKPHVVIVSFFATWCKPCLKEIKELKSVLGNFEKNNIQLFLIDLKEAKSVVEKFVRKHGLPGTILLDKYGVAAERYGVTILPRLFVINKNGKLVWKTRGYQKDFNKELMKVLKGLCPDKN